MLPGVLWQERIDHSLLNYLRELLLACDSYQAGVYPYMWGVHTDTVGYMVKRGHYNMPGRATQYVAP
jgi:hypothetical protein